MVPTVLEYYKMPNTGPAEWCVLYMNTYVLSRITFPRDSYEGKMTIFGTLVSVLFLHRSSFGPKNELQKKITSHSFSVTSTSTWYPYFWPISENHGLYVRFCKWIMVKKSILLNFETLWVEIWIFCFPQTHKIRTFCTPGLLLSAEKPGF